MPRQGGHTPRRRRRSKLARRRAMRRYLARARSEGRTVVEAPVRRTPDE